ncbi:MAG: PEP-CTERM sorting domain-containing protein [Planctomycetota bacterium]
MRTTHLGLLIALTLIFSNASAVLTGVSTSTPTVSFDNSSANGEDYFGLVGNGGMINGVNIDSSINAPDGSVAGEDIDGIAGSGGRMQMASWSLSLPGDALPGTGFTMIDFSGLFGANDGVFDNTDVFDFTFSLNGSTTSDIAIRYDRAGGDNFNDSLAIDTDGDGIGDGTAISTSGTAINFSDPGGAVISSVLVKLVVNSSGNGWAGGEEFWANGTLSAVYDRAVVPEPSSFLLIGIVTILGWGRRRYIEG